MTQQTADAVADLIKKCEFSDDPDDRLVAGTLILMEASIKINHLYPFFKRASSYLEDALLIDSALRKERGLVQ